MTGFPEMDFPPSPLVCNETDCRHRLDSSDAITCSDSIKNERSGAINYIQYCPKCWADDIRWAA